MSARIPLIYIRGYAMTESERNETAADPFCGFNIGSTLYRAVPEKTSRPAKFVFESPLVRLVTEFGYQHVYQNGADILDSDWEAPLDANGKLTVGIPAASLIIHRYYDDSSQNFGDGKARDITEYAQKLSDLIIAVRRLVCERAASEKNPLPLNKFKCNLIAHSMGGLVARAFLQNTKLGDCEARASVNKLFTFATPHNGIEMLGTNVPRWLTKNESNTFNRAVMAKYLDMKDIERDFGRVDLMPEEIFPSDKIFCMVGTNRGDYEVGEGVIRAFVGNGSDGLVKIANASLCGVRAGVVTRPAATAYAYRSHSGYFGIVNSEEAYQNLVRFLFGDVRVDIWMDIDQVRLPVDLNLPGVKVKALYQVELKAAPRGKRWFLTRRSAVEDSPACRTHDELISDNPERKMIYLSTVFLSKRASVDQNKGTLAYAMCVAIKVPDYEKDGRFWNWGHYEGADLFRDTAIVEVSPPLSDSQDWTVKYWWASAPAAVTDKPLNFAAAASGEIELELKFSNPEEPGIDGRLRLVVKPWE